MVATARLRKLISLINSKSPDVLVGFDVYTEGGERIPVGKGKSEFAIRIRNRRGLTALASLNQLAIAEAYMEGDLDFEGDLIKALSLQLVIPDRNRSVKAWRHLKPLLFGRERCNPEWIAKHYDSRNIQLVAADEKYNTYTPGIYDDDADSLEVGAERKLEAAFRSLKLEPNDRVLDIGSGWGGFLRYASCKGVHVTGITLSHHQKAYVERLVQEHQLKAEVIYQDFFTYRRTERFDGINMMGVVEDLSDYERVMKRLKNLIKPGKRVYLDFASAKDVFGTSSFITKYIWPGKFRMVFMPEFIEAVRNSPFEILSIQNDRRNYYLWSKKVNERWKQEKAEIVKQTDETFWRMLHVLYAGTASIMSVPSHYATAYRVVLEMPADAIFDEEG